MAEWPLFLRATHLREKIFGSAAGSNRVVTRAKSQRRLGTTPAVQTGRKRTGLFGRRSGLFGGEREGPGSAVPRSPVVGSHRGRSGQERGHALAAGDSRMGALKHDLRGDMLAVSTTLGGVGI